MPTEPRPTGPLRPIELATASVMAGVSVALTVIGFFLPHLGVVAALAVVPLGIVAHRHRLRALVVSAFAASVLSFLVAGPGTFLNVLECALVGGLVGIGRRRGWSFASVLLGAAVIGPLLAAVTVGLLLLFSSLRKLTLEQIRNTWHGVTRILKAFARFVPQLTGITNHLNQYINDALRDWWITVAVLIVLTVLWFSVLGWILLGAVLDRLRWIRAVDHLGVTPEDCAPDPAPVPVRLEHVSFRYPGAAVDALIGVSLDVRPSELAALLGDNGSGKSTLARVLAGRTPTSGRVERPGAAGLGRPGGTALIMQQPDTQVLGVRVADDVVWGLSRDHGVDVAAVLDSVGLAGFEDRETSTLSGGELQRLAVAAALARRPQLLISDESTAMVDEDGRELLTSLLHTLPRTHGMAVVHVTHRLEEVGPADRRFRLERGRLAGAGSADTADSAAGAGPGTHRHVFGPPVATIPMATFASAPLEVVNVSHTYGVGSPWAQTALHSVDLRIAPKEGVLIVGGNGSGKSTLAWIMAGVLRPTRGICRLGGEPVTTQVGSVGLAFQHARLQLQRSTVRKDIVAAGADSDAAVDAALIAVGLNSATLAERRIDELSGGQQRRVALAGLLARKPSVLLLDEPLAGLDDPGRHALLDVLGRLRHEQGLTIVVISHDRHGLEPVCDRVVKLESGRVVSDTVGVSTRC